MKRKNYLFALIFVATCMFQLTGCGSEETQEPQTEEAVSAEIIQTTGIEFETASDTYIDFSVLKNENPEIFAWLYVPEVGVDVPLLQSSESDDYYASHDAARKDSDLGAAYIEMANLSDMCDFNTVIHGSGGKDGLFQSLTQLEDPTFFDEHELFYIFTEDNLLTYDIVTAYRADRIDFLREYNFITSDGCNQFIKDIYSNKMMGKGIREGFENLNELNFLVTLSVDDPSDSNSQYVVVGALINDAAGKIDRESFDTYDMDMIDMSEFGVDNDM